MTLALLLSGIVLSALSSLIVLGSHAVPAGEGAQSSAIYAADAMEKLATELSVAKKVSVIDSRRVTFTVADWTGDALDEEITYSWGGDAGDPVEREVNGGGAKALVPAAQSFALTNVQGDREIIGDAEVTVTKGQRVHDANVSSTLLTTPISSGSYPAQRVAPSLGADARSWQITSVTLSMRGTSDSGPAIAIEIQGVTDDTLKPDGKVYARTSFDTSALSTLSMRTFSIAMDCPRVPADEDLCVVIRASTSRTVARANFGLPLIAVGTGSGYTTTDGGANWTTTAASVLDSEVFATVWTQPSATTTRKTLLRLRASVTLGESGATYERAIRLLNTPEVSP